MLDTFPPTSTMSSAFSPSSSKQAYASQFELSAPFPSAAASTSTQQSYQPSLFSPSLFAPSPLTPSAGPMGGYFNALSSRVGYEFGLLSQQAAVPVWSELDGQYFLPQQQQSQPQSSQFDSFNWSIDPPQLAAPQFSQPPAPTASLHDVESVSSGHSNHDHDEASSSSFSVHTPTSEDEAFAEMKAVEDHERGDDFLAGGGAVSDHSDAVRSADGKGTTIAQVLEEMGISRKKYDAMSPARKRQIRNKVSARAFRARKKSLVESLESQIVDKDHLIESLRKQVLKLQAANSKLESRSR